MSVARRTVLSDGVPLACRDHGRPGTQTPDLVLMHGAGMTQSALDPLIDALAGSFRIITFDFRGHGETPAASWSFDAAVGDLAAVIAAYGLTAPAVAGHSLGGMVAALHAARTPGSGPAINLDGHGLGRPEQYVGKDPRAAARWITRAQARSGRVMTVLGLLRPILGGRLADPRTLRAITDEVAVLDLLAVYREVSGPLLIVNAQAAAADFPARLMSDHEGMLRAYRTGVRRDVTALAQSRPNITLAETAAGHMLVRTHPEQTAALMRTFLHTWSTALEA